MKKTFTYILILLFFSSCLQENQEAEAIGYLQQGYEQENASKDVQAMFHYKQAEKAVQTVNNKKLHFLIYTAIGKLNAKYAHYELATNYFRKAIDLKLSVPIWHTMHRTLPPYSSEKKIIKIHAESLLRLIEQMDFTSQNAILLQQALKYKNEGEWAKADSLLQKAILSTSDFDFRCRFYAELADVYLQTDKPAKADSIYAYALKTSSGSLKASIYKNKYLYHQVTGEKEKVQEYLLKYIQESELLYASEDRADLLEIEKQYDYVSLMRRNEEYRRQWIIGLLSTLTIILSLGTLIGIIWKYHRKQKEELLHTYKKEAYALQTQIDNLHEQMEENEGEAINLQKQIAYLEAEKQEKDIRIHQLEVTFRAKRIALSPETAEAVQLYLNLINRTHACYHPSEDRLLLAHWLNISQNQWAERLVSHYPTLSNGEKDICYLFAIGFSLDEMADLLQIQPRSVDRVVYRICRKMGLSQGNKEDFAKQLNQLNTPVKHI